MKSVRIQKLREKLEELQADALFISSFHNILYFFDFETLSENEHEAFAVVTKKNAYLLTDARYEADVSKYNVCIFEPGKTLSFYMEDIALKENIKTFLFESEDLRYFEYAALSGRIKNIMLKPVYKLGETIREIKEGEEIEQISRACEVTDQCLEDLIPTFRVNQTEKEIAFAIEMYLKKKGYDLAFDPIVAADANSAVAHYNTKTGEGVVRAGSVLLIDFGAKVNHYLADITRMVFFGKQNDSVVKTYTHLLAVQMDTLAHVEKVGELKDLDKYCRSEMKKRELPDFAHSTGHGVGLQIHENPKVSYVSDDKKRDGQVITIEPGVYIPGKYGMRIEDTVVLKKGKAIPLTCFSKDLHIVS